MKHSEVKIGGEYMGRVRGMLVPVRIMKEPDTSTWTGRRSRMFRAFNLKTNRMIRISAVRLLERHVYKVVVKPSNATIVIAYEGIEVAEAFTAFKIGKAGNHPTIWLRDGHPHRSFHPDDKTPAPSLAPVKEQNEDDLVEHAERFDPT